MLSYFKHILKKYFIILKVRRRFSPEVQISQRKLFHYYSERAKSGDVPSLADTGFRVFSQFEEDGILLFIFSVIGMGSKTFIEIGADDGINSNCANLALNFGWFGLFIDSNPRSIERGQRFYSRYPHRWAYAPKFMRASVTRENINPLIADAGLGGEIDFLSIDIDGNDYWIWDALEIVRPRVVMIETHVNFGLRNLVVPYDPDFLPPGKHPQYHGASPVAMQKLGAKKGYRLIGANALGFNFIFIQNEIAEDLLPAAALDDVLRHRSVQEGINSLDPQILDWDFEVPIP